MVIITADVKKNVSNSINEIHLIRLLFGNPLILALIIILIILFIFTILFYKIDCNDITYMKQSKMIIYSYIILLISIFINNSILIYDYNKINEINNLNKFNNLPNNINNANIISSNINKLDEPLDIEHFLSN